MEETQDYDAFFNTSGISTVAAFQNASILAPSISGFHSASGFASAAAAPLGGDEPSVAFTSFSSAGGAKKFFQPSAAALVKEKRKMNELWSGDEARPSPVSPPRKRKENSLPPSPRTPSGPKAAPLLLEKDPDNVQLSQFSSASGTLGSQQPKPFKTPLPPQATRLKTKAFHSPLINSTPPANYSRQASPAPSQSAALRTSTPTVPSRRPTQTQSLVTPQRPTVLSSLSTPGRLGMSTRRANSPAKFSSPLIPGWKPSVETSKSNLSHVVTAGYNTPPRTTATSQRAPSTPRDPAMFDLCQSVISAMKPPSLCKTAGTSDRLTLAASGLFPSQYSHEDLEDMDMYVALCCSI